MDKQLWKQEVEKLRKMGRQFLNGEISRMELKGLSGGLGSYSQREKGHFMIRLRTNSGVVSMEHFALILKYAKERHLEKLHLTTRQTIQLHDLDIDAVCDIMIDAMEHDLYTLGGGGNFPRNVTLSPMAGVDPNEPFDVTPYALQTGRYFMERVTTYHLPRKLKVAFSSGKDDTGCVSINDLGFLPVMEDGQPRFVLYLAGGMGSHPALAVKYPETIAPEEVLYYVEAMVNLFKAEGNYENRAKARTRFIVERMGKEAFLECYNRHLAKVKAEEKFEGIVPQPVAYEPWEPEVEMEGIVIPQKQKDRYTVVVHPMCGQLYVEQADWMYDYLSNKERVELRLSMDQDIYVRNLSQVQAERMIDLTCGFNQLEKPGKTVTCIGTPICQLGVQASQELTQAIADLLLESEVETDKLPKIQINGCPNSCSRHPVAALGFAGRKKKIDGESTDCFDCFVGGKVGADAKLAKRMGTMRMSDIPQFVLDLAAELQSCRLDYDVYIETEEFTELVDKYLV